jgi:hypothetical protein
MRTMATLLLLALTVPALAAPGDGEARAERLATLRGEVDELSHALRLDEAALSSRLQTLDLARTELEIQIRQEELQLAQLQLQIDATREEVSAEGEASHVLVPSVEAGIDALRPAIEAGLPYRVPERLAVLDELQTGLDAGTLAPHRVASRLWQTYEDELRLGRENALDRQTILLEGEEVLVDVARIGLVALFFRTSDERVGWAAREGDRWGFVLAPDRTAKAHVLELFDALDKQIRVGAFTLPGVLPEVTR